MAADVVVRDRLTWPRRSSERDTGRRLAGYRTPG